MASGEPSVNLTHNPRQADMLASNPDQLASQAADMLRRAEESERGPEGRPSGQAVLLVLQAALAHLHQAVLLEAKQHLPVDTRCACIARFSPSMKQHVLMTASQAACVAQGC